MSLRPPRTCTRTRTRELLSVARQSGRASLRVRYRATHAGEWLLHVALRSRAVHGSPFRLRVLAAAAAAHRCIAHGAGLVQAAAGAEATFVVIAHDEFGNRCDSGGDAFSAELCCCVRPGEGSRLLAACELVDCEDGTYLGVFTPPADAPSACMLHIRLGAEQLHGSPFTCAVHTEH